MLIVIPVLLTSRIVASASSPLLRILERLNSFPKKNQKQKRTIIIYMRSDR